MSESPRACDLHSAGRARYLAASRGHWEPGRIADL